MIDPPQRGEQPRGVERAVSQEGGQAGERGGAGSGRWRLVGPARRLGPRRGRGRRRRPSRYRRRSCSAAGRAGQGRAARAGLRFCFASAASGRVGAAAPPPGSLLAAPQLSSEGEASAASRPAPRTGGPLTHPGLRARGVSGRGRERWSAARNAQRP